MELFVGIVFEEGTDIQRNLNGAVVYVPYKKIKGYAVFDKSGEMVSGLFSSFEEAENVKNEMSKPESSILLSSFSGPSM